MGFDVEGLGFKFGFGLWFKVRVYRRGLGFGVEGLGFKFGFGLGLVWVAVLVWVRV